MYKITEIENLKDTILIKKIECFDAFEAQEMLSPVAKEYLVQMKFELRNRNLSTIIEME